MQFFIDFHYLQHKHSSRVLPPSVPWLHSTRPLRKNNSFTMTNRQHVMRCWQRIQINMWGHECHIKFEATMKCVVLKRFQMLNMFSGEISIQHFYWKVWCVRSWGSLPRSLKEADATLETRTHVRTFRRHRWWGSELKRTVEMKCERHHYRCNDNSHISFHFISHVTLHL